LHDAALAWHESAGSLPSVLALHAAASSDPLQALAPLWQQATEGRQAGEAASVLAALERIEGLVATVDDADLPGDAPSRASLRELRAAVERSMAEAAEAPGDLSAHAPPSRFVPMGSERWGPFELKGVLGMGHRQVTYLADRVGAAGFRRTVAVRVLDAELASSEGAVADFQRGARRAAEFRHPVLVPAQELAHHGGRWLASYEWVDGPQIAELVPHGRGLPVGLAACIAARLARGLQALHEVLTGDDEEEGAIVTDLSPLSARIDRHGEVRLLEIGSPTSLTGAPLWDGLRPSYIAPEARAGKPSRESDLWSLGCVLFECLTGRRLFEGRSVAEVHDSTDRGDLRPAVAEVGGLDATLGELLATLLQRSPSARPTASATAAVLESVAARFGAHPESGRAELRERVREHFDSEV